MIMIVYILGAIVLFYLFFTLFLTYLVQQIPRQPVNDPPDWGRIIDTKIPTVERKFLEVWRIEPNASSRGTVILAHGWGRNRDRMVSRARYFGQWGFTTVIHSARDHGKSSPRRLMNALRLAEDIEAVLKWVKDPVILYGHSAGAGGAIIAASRNTVQIKLLILEACYANTKEALLSLYRWVNPFFGTVFGPMILFWMNLFYKNKLDLVSPARLAPLLKMPVMLIHGEKDRRFPLKFALTLKQNFAAGQAELYIAKGVGHSDSSTTPDYQKTVRSFLDRHWQTPTSVV
ncbi:MAG: alpha/beta hydrolase [Desulfobacterales bacterium]|nr:MAG: alpha/beta hydrolase [Desulfobacterales bacterium]